MKVKTSIVVFIAALLLYSSCSHVCAPDTTAQPPLFLEFKNSQGMDMLNPATPGHYDTTAIKNLNRSNNLVVVRAGVTASSPIFLSTTWTVAPTNNIISISLADQDTIFTSGQNSTSPCSTLGSLTLVKYNGVTLTRDTSKLQPYIVYKK